MNKSKLPKWAEDRLEAEEEMGSLESSAPLGLTVAVLFVWAVQIGIFIGFCVLVYIIGRAIVT